MNALIIILVAVGGLGVVVWLLVSVIRASRGSRSNDSSSSGSDSGAWLSHSHDSSDCGGSDSGGDSGGGGGGD